MQAARDLSADRQSEVNPEFAVIADFLSDMLKNSFKFQISSLGFQGSGNRT